MILYWERDKGIFMLIMGRDYQYRDCDVERYIWDEEKRELNFFCNYHGRENIKISIQRVNSMIVGLAQYLQPSI